MTKELKNNAEEHTSEPNSPPSLIMAIISENENGWGHCSLFRGLHALVVFSLGFELSPRYQLNAMGFAMCPFKSHSF